jgi:hypothetical protein
VLELGERASQVLDERAGSPGGEELQQGAVVPELVVDRLVGEAIPQGVALGAIVADDRARVVDLVGERDAQRALDRDVGQVGEIARLALAPGARVVRVEAVRAGLDDGRDLGASGATSTPRGTPRPRC